MVWFGLVLWHINHCRLFNANSCLQVHIEYIWFVNIFAWGHFCTQLNGFTYCYLIWIILFGINHLLHTVKWFQVLLCNSYNLTFFCTHKLIYMIYKRLDLLVISFLKRLELIFCTLVLLLFLHSWMVSSTAIKHLYFYSISIICLHTVKQLQVFLLNTNSSVQHYLFVYTELNGFQILLCKSIQLNISHLFTHC